MSRRFRIVLPLAWIVVAALAAGCEDEAISAPAASAATPAASAPAASSATSAAPGTPAAVSAEPSVSPPPAKPNFAEACSEVTDISLDAASAIADVGINRNHNNWTPEQVKDGLRAAYGVMAGKLADLASRTGDRRLKAALKKSATVMAAGATSNDPEPFLQDEFRTVVHNLYAICP